MGWLGGAAATLRLAELLWAPGGTPLLLQRFESACVEAAFLDYHFRVRTRGTQAFTGTMVGQVGLTYLFLRRNARGRGDELVVQQCALTVIGYAALFALRHWLRTWPDASRARTAFVTTWIGFYVVCVLHASRSAWGNGELRESLQVGALLLGALFTLLLTAYNHVALPLEPPQRVASVGLALVQATFRNGPRSRAARKDALLLAAALGGDVVVSRRAPATAAYRLQGRLRRRRRRAAAARRHRRRRRRRRRRHRRRRRRHHRRRLRVGRARPRRRQPRSLDRAVVPRALTGTLVARALAPPPAHGGGRAAAAAAAAAAPAHPSTRRVHGGAPLRASHL